MAQLVRLLLAAEQAAEQAVQLEWLEEVGEAVSEHGGWLYVAAISLQLEPRPIRWF